MADADPAGFADGLNLYAYVNNNPLIYVDAYGFWKEECEALDRSVREFSRELTRGFFDDVSASAHRLAGLKEWEVFGKERPCSLKF